MAEASRTGTPLLAKVADAPAFSVGEHVRNITAGNVNLRAAPGGPVLAAVLSGGQVAVTGAAVQHGELTWWPVRWVEPEGETVEGWMAEGTGDGTALLASAGLAMGGAI